MWAITPPPLPRLSTYSRVSVSHNWTNQWMKKCEWVLFCFDRVRWRENVDLFVCIVTLSYHKHCTVRTSMSVSLTRILKFEECSFMIHSDTVTGHIQKACSPAPFSNSALLFLAPSHLILHFFTYLCKWWRWGQNTIIIVKTKSYSLHYTTQQSIHFIFWFMVKRSKRP